MTRRQLSATATALNNELQRLDAAPHSGLPWQELRADTFGALAVVLLELDHAVGLELRP